MSNSLILQNTTQLIVNVVDVNDVVPTFLDPAYTGFVAENQPIGSPVAVVSYMYLALVVGRFSLS